MITPAISVLSAIEGLEVAGSDLFDPYVEPITVVILIAAVSVPGPGDRRRGKRLRARPPAMVPRDRDPGRVECGHGTECPARRQSVVRGGVPLAPRLARFSDPGDGVSGRYRRRSTVCRHRSFRQAAHPAQLVLDRPAGAVAELLWTRRLFAARPRRRGSSLLWNGPRLGAVPAGRAGDRGRGDRFAGHHHRGVLADAPIRSARLCPADDDPAHLVPTRAARSMCPRSTGH